MTNKEAISELVDIYTNALDFKDGITTSAFNMAIEALEKANKYRWHDLRKDPNDLPEINDTSYVPCIVAYSANDIVITDYCEYAYIDNFGWLFCGISQDEVIAWKYIEEFRENENV